MDKRNGKNSLGIVEASHLHQAFDVITVRQKRELALSISQAVWLSSLGKHERVVAEATGLTISQIRYYLKLIHKKCGFESRVTFRSMYRNDQTGMAQTLTDMGIQAAQQSLPKRLR